MEVHHHPDLDHKKKKWKEYFLEFLMIFIAVTLGFLAENLREHLSDRAKEKTYVEGLVRDLTEDTAVLHHVIEAQTLQKKGLDSLTALVKSDLRIDSIRRQFYRYVINYCYNSSAFTSNDATIQQLKSTGDFRLIEKDHVVDSISQIEGDLRQVYMQRDYYQEYFKQNLDRLDDLIDVTVIGDPAYDPNGVLSGRPYPPIRGTAEQLATFFNKLFVFKIIVFSNIKNDLEPQLAKSVRLIQFFKQEFAIE